MFDEILISVIIPTKNAEPWLKDQRQSFLSQTLFQKSEFIYIDSGSIDNTIGILLTFNDIKLINIPPKEFNHGETRNLGVKIALGKFVVLTVQDAKPTSSTWLEDLLTGFTDDKVAGVCGRQIVPHEDDTNPIEWFQTFSQPGLKRIELPDVSYFEKIDPLQMQAMCGWDNVNAVYRRSVLLDVPFRRISFGEDAYWAHDVLLRGFAIVYSSVAQVYHYHSEDYHFAFKRSMASTYLVYKLYGIMPKRVSYLYSLRQLLSNCKTLLRTSSLNWSLKWGWLLYSFTKRRAVSQATLKMIKALKRGGDLELNKLYEEVCGIPPIASFATQHKKNIHKNALGRT